MKIVSICFIFIIIYKGYAQDKLIKLNGDTLITTIKEILPNEIKYYNFGEENGVLYTEYRYNFHKIIFRNGKEKIFKKK